MFRIDKRMVQISPLDQQVPLTPVEIEAVVEPKPAETLPEEPPALTQEQQQAADKLLQQARTEAEGIRRKAEQQAEAMREQARAEGYQAGAAEAAQAGQKQLAQGAQEIRQLLMEIATARDDLYASYESEIVSLSLDIAHKIVATAIGEDKEIFESIITNALKQMKREGKITIRISETQYDTFFNADSATFVLGDESIQATIVKDPLLNSGDLHIEADGETINAGLDTQLKYITMAFGRAGDLEDG